jgi:hypothetical protein
MNILYLSRSAGLCVGLLTASAVFSPLAASAADLYVSSLARNTISRIAPDGTVSTFVSGLNAPANLQLAGIAFSGGFLYAADFGNNAIQKFASDGTFTTFASGLNIPAGLAFDASGNLLAVDFGTRSVNKISPAGQVSPFIAMDGFTSGVSPEGIAIRNGDVYVSSRNAIDKFSSSGNLVGSGLGVNIPIGLAFDASGKLFEADFGTNTIKVLTLGTFGIFASGFNQPEGIAFDNTFSNLFVANRGTSSIKQLSTLDRSVSTFASGIASPYGLAFAPADFVPTTAPTTAVPEPFTIIGTLIGGTAAMRMRTKLKSNVEK